MHKRQKMKKAAEALGGDCRADSYGIFAANYSTLATGTYIYFYGIRGSSGIFVKQRRQILNPATWA